MNRLIVFPPLKLYANHKKQPPQVKIIVTGDSGKE
jgi:hypothetical protein